MQASTVTLKQAPVVQLWVAGFTPFTTLDFPGKLSAVIFLAGCPWRCHYCHNPALALGSVTAKIAWNDVLDVLAERKKWLDAVVFSGGEPTLNKHLPRMMADVRTLGFSIGLHTGGMFPERVAACLPHVDWVGLDIKALPHQYQRIVQRDIFLMGVWETLDLLLASEIDFECRTTVVWELTNTAQLMALGELLAAKGVRRYAVQIGRLQHCLNSNWQGKPNAMPANWPQMQARLQQLFESFELRY